MSYAIVYSSRTGNTALLAGILRDNLPQGDCCYIGEPSEEALNAQRVYAGFWTDKGSCNKEMADFLSRLTDQELFLFGTAGFGGSKTYFDAILERTMGHAAEGVTLVGSYMCQGKMPLSVRERYEKMAAQGVPRIKEMIENFDQALLHPNREDLDGLKQQLLQIQD